MKLDTATINVLKNFSAINPSILVKEGNVLTTISPSKTILARAKVPTAFPKRFAIYELSKFIGSLSLIEDPELEFNERHVLISNGNGKNIRYTFADESNIKTPPEKDVNLPTVDVSFSTSEEALKEVIKAAGVMGLPEIAVVGENGKVTLRAVDSKNPSSSTYDVDVGTSDKTFRVIFKTENILKITGGKYDVSISSKGISHFKGEVAEYWIAVETSSTF
jgi:hypothetical protein